MVLDAIRAYAVEKQTYENALYDMREQRETLNEDLRRVQVKLDELMNEQVDLQEREKELQRQRIVLSQDANDAEKGKRIIIAT